MAKHVHNWSLRRIEKRDGRIYKFWVCTNPGCPNPDKMTVD